MGLFNMLNLEDNPTNVDWEMTPEYSFGTFESWGGRERVRNKGERFYYFYIDGWQDPPRLCLMERGIKHARLLEMIDAPREMIDRCTAKQGKSSYTDKNFAIDGDLKAELWGDGQSGATQASYSNASSLDVRERLSARPTMRSTSWPPLMNSRVGMAWMPY